jgi:ubiquinone/menaquinone biosynthesis C-methylase UbiE
VLTLDVGCGGNALFEFNQFCDPEVSCDLLKPTRKLKNFVKCDAHNLPFPDKAFGLVTLIDVLEHVDSPVQVLREIKRVGKMLLLSTPNATYLPRTLLSIKNRSQKAAPCDDHIQLWSKAELENLLNRVHHQHYCVVFQDLKRARLRFLTRFVLALTPFPALKHRSLVAQVTW